jgi:LPS sulfotransferase NodH
MNLQEIIAAARRETGLTSLGDEGFLDGMGRLIDSMNHEVTFAPGGEAAMAARLQRIIVNRLRFTADLARHPEILEAQLLPPVVILGLPRVGSTKLQRMLAASGTFQEALFWQVLNPARCHEDTRMDEEARIAQARAYLTWRDHTSPAANAAHSIAIHEAEEETFLLEFSFETMYPMTFVQADRYYDWVEGRSGADTYAYLGKLLSYLQWQFRREQPKPWLLKSPPNLGFEAQIQAFAPDARFIMSHRDPVTVIASLAALVQQSRRLYSANIDPAAIGRWCLRAFSDSCRRHLAWRERNPQIEVLDISYSSIEKQPMRVVEEVYEFLGLKPTPAVRAGIEAWLAADAHGTGKRHVYALADCGLSAAEINAAFAGYIERFSAYLA